MSDIGIEVLKQRAVPLSANEPGVYALFREDLLVYVGQSWNCFLGVAEQTRKENPKQFDRWTFIREPDEEARKARVKVLVLEHSPEYNKRSSG